MGKDVIIACDFDSAAKTFAFLDQFTGRKPFVKIGMELYYAEGPSIVREIKARGHKIFLDLKLHDIPNTVKKAMAVLSRLDVDMTNLHAAGTGRMMEAAIEGLTRPDGTRPMLIAVTQLTSTDQESMENDLLIKEPIAEVVMHYATVAKNAGLDGSVIVDKVLSSKKANYGFDALNNKYCDMVESGIIDPTKVTRSVLQNAASVAATLLTTESIVTDIPTPPTPAPAGGDMGGMY